MDSLYSEILPSMLENLQTLCFDWKRLAETKEQLLSTKDSQDPQVRSCMQVCAVRDWRVMLAKELDEVKQRCYQAEKQFEP